MDNIIASGLSVVGHVREQNEDSFLVDTDAGIFLVADGMGGHVAGEIASKMAIDVVAAGWQSPKIRRQIEQVVAGDDLAVRQELLRSVRDSVTQANVDIIHAGQNDRQLQGMGTTVIGFLIVGSEAIFAHAGDSRAYLIRDNIPVLLSEDHTMVARMRAAGIEQGKDGIEPSYWKGVLTNALGMKGAKVTTFVVPLYCADRFVLCSDGIHDYFSEVEIGEMVCQEPSPARAAQRLVDEALDRGGEDNATVVVVKIVEAGLTQISTETRERREQVLISCPLLAGLSLQERLRALRITTPRSYEAGRTLPRVALEDTVAYIVLEGEIAVRGTRRSGTAGPGTVLLPESLVRASAINDAQLEALSDTQVLMIRRNDFEELCSDDIELSVSLYEALGTLVQSTVVGEVLPPTAKS